MLEIMNQAGPYLKQGKLRFNRIEVTIMKMSTSMSLVEQVAKSCRILIKGSMKNKKECTRIKALQFLQIKFMVNICSKTLEIQIIAKTLKMLNGIKSQEFRIKIHLLTNSELPHTHSQVVEVEININNNKGSRIQRVKQMWVQQDLHSKEISKRAIMKLVLNLLLLS